MPLIHCPSCEASYDVAAETVAGAGAKVRCAACKTLWIARAETEVPAEVECRHDRTAALAEMALAPPELLTAERPSAPLARVPWHQRIKGPQQAAAGARWPGLALAAIVLLIVGGIGLRKHVVKAAPETAKLFGAVGLPVNLRGLELSAVKSGVMNEGSMEILVVQGVISNVTTHKQAVPPLRFSVRDGKNVEIYAWTANADVRMLDPGQTVAFRRRLASPPQDSSKVMVRFSDAPEAVALAH
jgi:predicted Zn finger-like uncharacterized protein